MVDTNDAWITERTGIRARHISAKDEETSEMAYKATLNALDMAGIKATELDGIIFPTITPDYIMPDAAAQLQNRLGIPGGFAFTMNCACSGFVYALGVADSMIRAGMCKTILIAAAERLSTITDWTDRGTCILFGDAAGAAILRADDAPGIRRVNLHADGRYGDLLSMYGMGSHYMANRADTSIEDNLVKMKGNEIFKLAVRAMCDAAEQAVIDAGLSLEDIDYIIPHQANIRIIDAAAKRLNLREDQVVINIDRRGNTSSATIPTALDEAIRDGRLKKGSNVVVVTFGGGLNWGAGVITL
jgi:3-oxoacyl-[acyl-carrier-protein] synthase-3